MKLGMFKLGLAGLALAAVALASSNSPAGDGPVDFRFSKPPVNGLGLQSLAELRGKPVLIDFWGTR